MINLEVENTFIKTNQLKLNILGLIWRYSDSSTCQRMQKNSENVRQVQEIPENLKKIRKSQKIPTNIKKIFQDSLRKFDNT